MSRVRYTEEEHWALQEAVKQVGPNWRKDIGKLKTAYDQIFKDKFPHATFNDRKGEALRAHWDSLIKTGPDTSPWSADELEKLKQLHTAYGNDFSSIKYELGTGRSVTAIKKKIREIMDQNLMNPYSPIMGWQTTTSSFSRPQMFPPKVLGQETDAPDANYEERFEELRQEVENVQTEIKSMKDTLQQLVSMMQNQQNPQ